MTIPEENVAYRGTRGSRDLNQQRRTCNTHQTKRENERAKPSYNKWRISIFVKSYLYHSALISGIFVLMHKHTEKGITVNFLQLRKKLRKLAEKWSTYGIISKNNLTFVDASYKQNNHSSRNHKSWVTRDLEQNSPLILLQNAFLISQSKENI
jgi:hypothetical protein